MLTSIKILNHLFEITINKLLLEENKIKLPILQLDNLHSVYILSSLLFTLFKIISLFYLQLKKTSRYWYVKFKNIYTFGSRIYLYYPNNLHELKTFFFGLQNRIKDKKLTKNSIINLENQTKKHELLTQQA